MRTAAIIGTGGISTAHVNACHAQANTDSPVDLQAAVDIDADRAAAFAQQHGIARSFGDAAAMLAEVKPDLVCICTPPQTHADLCIASMQAGADVLCEKPLCLSLAEVDRIAAASRETGKHTCSVYQWRFGSAATHVRQLIQSAAVGKPLVGICQTTWYRGDDYYAAAWRGRYDNEGGGCSLGHGIHATDLFLWLFAAADGGEWQRVTSRIATLNHDIEVEDAAIVTVEFASGALASVVNSTVSPRQETRLRIDCSQATLECTALYAHSHDDWRIDGIDAEAEMAIASESWRAWPSPEVRSSQSAQLAAMLAALDANETPPGSTVDDTANGARNALAFLTALYQSAMTDQPVARNDLTADSPWYRSFGGQR